MEPLITHYISSSTYRCVYTNHLNPSVLHKTKLLGISLDYMARKCYINVELNVVLNLSKRRFIICVLLQNPKSTLNRSVGSLSQSINVGKFAIF